MKITLKKDKFKEIENAFSVLQEDPKNVTATKIIKSSLEECFGVEFNVSVIPCDDVNKPLFVMSVFPEMSTVEKIITAIMTDDKKKDNTIKKLWEQNKVWYIEIDERVLGNTIHFTNVELTAMLLHEVGHIVASNSLPSRFITIIQYEVAKSSMQNRAVLKDRMFKKILSLPILNACISDDKNKNSLKEEIKADKFVKSMGYTKELTSALGKLIQSNKYPNSGTKDKNMKELTNFSLNTAEQLRTRQSNLLKKNLFTLKTECTSPYIKSMLEDYESLLFENCNDTSFCDGKKLDWMLERAEDISKEECITEFFIFGGKQLKRIDPAELDYIEVKMGEIKTDSDKMMLISYLYNKLDIIEYYMHILSDPKLSKKYIIPHSMDQLKIMQIRLLKLKEQILKYQIPERNKGLLVAWPQNYEG